jgi:diphthamide biosynthesis protein 2
MADAKPPTLYRDSGIERSININEHSSQRQIAIHDYYDINYTAEIILKYDFKRIALQFPDSLLSDSSAVIDELQKKTNRIFFVLGDTSYGECCVDEVAAEHFAADFIVHYGRTCLSPTRRLPVYYVFGKNALNVDSLLDQMKSSSVLTKDDSILIFYDVAYEYAMADLGLKLNNEGFKNVVVSTLSRANIDSVIKGSAESSSNVNTTQSTEPSSAHEFSGRKYTLLPGTSISDYKMLFIGSSEVITLNNIAVTYNRNEVFTFDPKTNLLRKESLNVNRMLMRRFTLIEKAKDSNTFGILVGTLSVSRYMDIINHLRSIIKNAGKKSYTFLIGKINVPKLANFMEIDMFVIVACPENSLIDSKDFFKPIVTPFELEIALVKGKEWSNQYTTDFNQVLAERNILVETDQEEEETRVSLLSGTVTMNPKSFKPSENTSTDTSLATIGSGEITTYSGAQYLSQRTFKGLEQRIGETPVTLAAQGRSGIAMSYEEEPEKKDWSVTSNVVSDEIEEV